MADVSGWSENAASNNASPPAGWPSVTMLPNEVQPTGREMMAAVKRWHSRISPTVTSGGSANVHTLTYTVAPAAYVAGDCYTFIAGFSNTGAATLNVNALGAKSIKMGSRDIVSGDIVAGRIVTVYYDGTNFQLLTPNGNIDSDSVNAVTEFGADPTGVVDATSAINAALSATKNGMGVNVYLPPGTYKVTDSLIINGLDGQTLYGDDRIASIISVPATFNMLADGVVVIDASGQAGKVLNLGISFTQPDSSTRGDYTEYPPAIYMQGAVRSVVDGVRISGAWDGIDARGNTGGSYLGFLEIGALNQGIQVDGALDFFHGHVWHFAFFGFSTANRLTAYRDGDTSAGTFADSDVMEVNAIVAYYCNLTFGTSDTIAPTTIGRLIMDGQTPNLTISGQRLIVNTMHIKALSTNTAVNIDAGGLLAVGYFDMTADSSGAAGADAVVVNSAGAQLSIASGRVLQSSNDHAAFRVAAGSLVLNNVQFRQPSGAARTVAQVVQSGASATIRMMGNRFDAKSGGATGAALSIATDNAANHIVANDFTDWTVTLPSAITLGEYGPNKVAVYTATPTVLFTSLGNFSPTYAGGADQRFTQYEFMGEGLVHVHTIVTFDTNAYTTPAGSFQIDLGTPVVPLLSTPLTIGRLDNVVFGSSNMIFAEIASTGNVFFRLAASGGAVTNFSTTAVPASTTGFILRVGGIFRYK